MNPVEIVNISQDSVGPGIRESPMMAYDPFNNVTVLFGGNEETDGTWFYDYSSNTWTEHIGPGPSGRGRGAMTYCSTTNEIILYGGQGRTDTWSFDCESQTWSEVNPSTSPDLYDSHAMAYDPIENVIILFGGFGEGNIRSNSTWSFDCETRDWTRLQPVESPRARYAHVMTYDSGIEKMVMTCGSSGNQGYLNDTWTYDVSTNTWSEVVVGGNIDALKWSAMVYDSINEKNILFGGNIPDIEVGDTLIFDTQTDTWINAHPISSPGPRDTPGFAFDSKYAIVVLHGGMTMDGSVYYGDTWIYSYASNTWTRMGTTPGTTSGTTFAETLTPELAWTIGITVAIGAASVAAIVLIRRKKME